jgi:hypothetical protein
VTSSAPARQQWRRLPAVDEINLRWLWTDASAAIRMRSAFGAQLERARLRLGRTPGDVQAASDIDEEVMARLSSVLARLARCTATSVRVLRACYAPESDPDIPSDEHARLSVLGEMAHVMLLTPELEAWRRHREPAHTLIHALVSLSLREGEASVLQAVRMRADAMLAKACEEYSTREEPKR